MATNTLPTDWTAFPDFYGRLASALEWPDKNQEMRLDKRAESWALEISLALHLARDARIPIRWTSITDPHGQEARRVLVLAERFDQKTEEYIGKAGFNHAAHFVTFDPEIHSAYVLLLERVLVRPTDLLRKFKDAVLKAANELCPCADTTVEPEERESEGAKPDVNYHNNKPAVPEWVYRHFRSKQFMLLKTLFASANRTNTEEELCKSLDYKGPSKCDSLRRRIAQTNSNLTIRSDEIGDFWSIRERTRDGIKSYFLDRQK